MQTPDPQALILSVLVHVSKGLNHITIISIDPQPQDVESTDTNKEKYYFAYSASLRVFGSALDFSAISAALNLQPTHVHRKGERGRLQAPWEHDRWSYDPPLDKSESLHKHIDALWESIKAHKAYLPELKKQATVDVFLGYRSDCETAGVEVPHRFEGLIYPIRLTAQNFVPICATDCGMHRI